MIVFPENCTIGDMYFPAMKITSQEEADEYFEAAVQFSLKQNLGMSREEAERIQRFNFEYVSGYFDNETRRRIKKLFSCKHLIIGD